MKRLRRPLVVLLSVVSVTAIAGWFALPPSQGQAGASKTTEKPPPVKADSAEAGIRKITDDYVKAFNAKDAKAIAGLFTTDGDFIGPDGEELVGRAAIEADYAESFKATPKGVVEVQIETIRPMGRGIARAVGVAKLKIPGSDVAGESKYSAIHVLEDGQWRVASLREWIPDPAVDVTVGDLGWLAGDWTAKGDGGELKISYAWDENKTFLQAKYAITKNGKTVTSGMQIIGTNPDGGLKSWMFDGSGTTSEGVWTRDDNRWLIESLGVLPDGTAVAAQNLISPLGPDSFTWRTMERSVDNVSLSAPPPVKVTRVAKPK
ncbi:YybH family protein [Zavarzinella formosa]|uniref:YybH family protein n=1 Tax=Zavarzinella formosa TaxID=360055 RepID=UPI0002E750A1|nr:nuclear transport factor 2 family protein [Zavarzinella formosa]